MPSPLKIEEAIRDTRLRTLVHKYLVANGQEESYAFLFEKSDNQTLYTKYVSAQANKQVNVPDPIRRPMDKQARAGQWAEMDANMKKARKSIVDMLNADVMPRFTVSEEYQGYLRSQDDSPAGKLVAALKLKGDKVALATGLFKVYSDARTPVEKYQAYERLAKVAGGELKLNAALKLAGAPVPDAMKKGDPAKAMKAFKRVGRDLTPAVEAQVLTLLKKYNSSSLRSVREDLTSILIKLVTKHSLNPREMVGTMLFEGNFRTSDRLER